MLVDLGRLALDPPVFLAPMAGTTDVPFRALAARFAAQARAELGLDDGRTAVQLAGRGARWMEAARLCEGGRGSSTST